MLRNQSFTPFIQQKPRKMLKLDLIDDKRYNEFEGNSEVDYEQLRNQIETVDTGKNAYNFQASTNQIKNSTICQEIDGNEKIYKLISKDNFKYRKVNDSEKDNTSMKIEKAKLEASQLKKQQHKNLPKVKLQEGQEQTVQPKIQQQQQKVIKNQKQQQQKPKQKPLVQPSSNWKNFLSQSATVKNQNLPSSADHPSKPSSKFIAMDCQFVKCQQQDHLARISIISQSGQTLYDSYIKPTKRITDYITTITGITYSHLKNAPMWVAEVDKVKKILMGKILVGHTLHKDLEVCKLTGWKGVMQKVDVSEFSVYRQKNGSKVVSLKRLAISFLNKNIQSGWHSSVEDAVATMDLFKLNKKKILKQLKFI